MKRHCVSDALAYSISEDLDSLLDASALDDKQRGSARKLLKERALRYEDDTAAQALAVANCKVPRMPRRSIPTAATNASGDDDTSVGASTVTLLLASTPPPPRMRSAAFADLDLALASRKENIDPAGGKKRARRRPRTTADSRRRPLATARQLRFAPF